MKNNLFCEDNFSFPCRLIEATESLDLLHYHRLVKEVFFDPFEQKYDPNYSSPCDLVKKYVRYQKENIVGAAKVDMYPGKGLAILRLLAVDKKYQRQGLGSFFLNQLHIFLTSQKCSKVLVNAESNVVNFYRKNSYRETSFYDEERMSSDSVQMSYDFHQ